MHQMNYELTPEDIEAFGRQTELPYESQRKFLVEWKPTLPMTDVDRAVFSRQMALYYDAYMTAAEERVVARYAQRDVDMTLGWWRRFCGQPILVNKLRGRHNAILELNDLIHPETLEKMARPLPRATAYPDYGVAPVWLIV
jgi:hypothetical protein